MRPRVFPAEDAVLAGGICVDIERASMRPRVFPAEDDRGEDARQVAQVASMRPRVFPAEDLPKMGALLFSVGVLQ